MKWYFTIAGGHTHVRVFMNGGKCGGLCFRNEEFELVRESCPWVQFIDETKHKPAKELFNTLTKPLDLTHPSANMYGVFPCPNCKSIYRWPNQQGQVICDDCGLTQTLPNENIAKSD